MKYKLKNPVLLDAIKFVGTNWIDVCIFVGEGNYKLPKSTREEYEKGLLWYITILTEDGLADARIGDYIIKSINGGFKLEAEDVFENKYELVSEE